MNRWQLAEEDKPAKDTGKSPQTEEKNQVCTASQRTEMEGISTRESGQEG